MSDFQRYDGRRVLVTGGGSVIGQATVLRILREGGRVVAADISDAGLKDTVAKAGAHAERLNTVTVDVAEEESVRAGVGEAVRLLGGLDTLVNAAGMLCSLHFELAKLARLDLAPRLHWVSTLLG